VLCSEVFTFQLTIHVLKTMNVLVCGQSTIILTFEGRLLYAQEIDLFISGDIE
jgi:hypothetical protein